MLGKMREQPDVGLAGNIAAIGKRNVENLHRQRVTRLGTVDEDGAGRRVGADGVRRVAQVVVGADRAGAGVVGLQQQTRFAWIDGQRRWMGFVEGIGDVVKRVSVFIGLIELSDYIQFCFQSFYCRNCICQFTSDLVSFGIVVAKALSTSAR